MMKIYLFAAWMTAWSIAATAQTSSEKGNNTLERIEEQTPWLNSSNAAGLSFNPLSYSFSQTGGYYNSTSGGYRNYNQAEQIRDMGVFARSYTRYKKFHFYGNFQYDYAIREQQAWLGTTYENSHLNPLLDSIPGKNLRESYRLGAKASYDFSRSFAAGIVFRYNAGTSAKRIDGRNTNTCSDVFVSPGVTFAREKIRAGFNLIYGYNAEDVEYTYLGDGTGKQLLSMEGLSLFTRSNIINAMIKERRYQQNLFGAGVQLEWRGAHFSFYNQFEASYQKENDYEDNHLDKRYAIINTGRYAYTGILKYATRFMDNSLRITYSNRNDLSYHVLNMYEPVPGENNAWNYYEYGKVLRYVAQEELLGAEYRGFVKKDETLSKIDFTLGIQYRRTDKQEKVFPADYSQKLHLYDYYGTINKNFEAGRSLIRLNVCGGYTVGNGDPLLESNPLTSGSLTLNKSLLARDYAFRTGSNYRIGGGLTYAYKINPQRGQTLSLGVHYLYRKLLDVKDSVFALSPDFSGFGNNRRNYLNVQVGFSF